MNEHWIQLRAESGGPLTLVLDTSESAAPHWGAIRDLAGALNDALPAEIPKRLMFLGSGEEYDPAEFATQFDRWRQSNDARGSLITPVFETLQAKEVGDVLVIGAGRIFDLDDWSGTPLLERASFASLGAPLAGENRTEVFPSLEELRQRFDSRIARVEIGFPAGMPFDWDNPAYRLDGTGLVAEGAESLSTAVGFLAAGDAPPRAVATVASGGARSLALQPYEPRPPVFDWQQLTLAESERLRECVRARRYRCPFCGGEHADSAVRCPCDPPPGRLVYPTLVDVRGIVLLRDFAEQVRFHVHPCPALRLAGDVVAVRVAGQAELYGLDAATGVWRRSGRQMPAYYWLGDRTYALVL
jgi:hypothetical protein